MPVSVANKGLTALWSVSAANKGLTGASPSSFQRAEI
jgi:hypothetical protein